MLVLAVDSTTTRESVAVADGDVLLGEVRLRPRAAHSRRLAPAIEFLLASLDLAPGEIEGYAVTLGPGSFTGIRVGLATVQGLALAAGKPVLGVSALDVLAARARGTADAVVAVMEAGRGQLFARTFDGAGQPLGEAGAVTLADLLASAPPRAAWVGDAVDSFRDLLPKDAVRPARSLYIAGTLALLAVPRLAAGEGVTPDRLRPLYLRGAHIRGQATTA